MKIANWLPFYKETYLIFVYNFRLDFLTPGCKVFGQNVTLAAC